MNNIKWQKFLCEIKGTSYIGKGPAEVLSMLDDLGSRVWIFFDTETTGLRAKREQLTEIAAIAINPNDWLDKAQIMDTFHIKIKLTDDLKARLNDLDSEQRKAWEKQNAKSWKPLKEPQDILRMTQYGDKNMKPIDQQQALSEFREFIAGFNEPILVAQNATFDMGFINTLSKEKLPRYKVIDTLQLLDHQIQPVLNVLSTGNFEPFDVKIQKRANDILKIMGKSSSLGKVADAYGISAQNWHRAIDDVKMLMDVYKKIVDTLKYAAGLQKLDLRAAQEKSVKKVKKQGR